jgi:hypothetical protein
MILHHAVREGRCGYASLSASKLRLGIALDREQQGALARPRRGWHSFGHRAFRNPSMNGSMIY